MRTLDEVIKAFDWCINNDLYECDECPYDKEEEGCHHRNLDALHYMREYQKLKIESEWKWISVTEALPWNETNVLVTVHDDSGDTPWEYTSTGWRTPDGQYWVVDNEMCYGVIAWMPLPEPWKGDQ